MSEPLAPPSLTPPPPPPPPPAGGAGGGLPWEQRDGAGAAQAFVETVRLLLSTPGAGFARARRRGDLVPPLSYAVIVTLAGVIAERLWNLAIGTSFLAYLPPQMRENGAFAFALSGIGLVVALVVMPVIVLIAIFLWSAIIHLFLLMYGATKSSEAGFEGTLRVLSWSTTSQLAQLVPFAGGLIAFIWGVVLQTIGLAEMHRTTPGKALAAILTPLLLCCVCLGAFMGIFFAGLLAAIASGHQP